MQQYGDKAIEEAAQYLERWPNEYGAYLIHLEHPEYAALCPRSGYPDTGTIVVDYIPDKYLIELKTFKLYINSFRNQRISHENATNKIADRLYEFLLPATLRVIGDFTRRGGVKTVITVWRGEPEPFDPYLPNVL